MQKHSVRYETDLIFTTDPFNLHKGMGIVHITAISQYLKGDCRAD